MAGLAIAAAIGCMTLPETYNQPTMETLLQDQNNSKKEEYDNKNGTVDKHKDEKATLV